MDDLVSFLLFCLKTKSQFFLAMADKCIYFLDFMVPFPYNIMYIYIIKVSVCRLMEACYFTPIDYSIDISAFVHNFV